MALGCAEPNTQDSPDEVRLEERLRIGSADGPESLTSVSQIALRDSLIAIAQSLDGQIRVFTTAGSHVATIGRRGRGPGEFEAISAIGFVGDELYVSDRANGRVSFYDSSWNLRTTLRSSTPRLGTAFPPVTPIRLLPDSVAIARPSPLGAAGEDADLVVPLLRVSWAGAMVDTVASAKWGSRQVTLRAGGVTRYTSHSFAEYVRLSVSPSGESVIRIERTGEGVFQVARLNVDGVVTDSAEIRYAPIPIPAQIRDSIFDHVLSRLDERFGSRLQKRALVSSALDLPDTYPPVTGTVAASDGSVWIRREISNGTVRWLILNEDLDVRGELELPVGTIILDARDREIWARTRDEFDVPYVVRYELVGL